MCRDENSVFSTDGSDSAVPSLWTYGLERENGEGMSAILKIYGRSTCGHIGILSREDASFLYRAVFRRKPEVMVEIGTAAGSSTAVSLCALHEAHGHSFRQSQLHAFDISTQFYADPSKPTGYLVDIMAPMAKEILRLHVPATSRNARELLGERTVDMAFIDGNHFHPWAALDFIALLPTLRDGALVCVHDVNLPILWPQHTGWGPKWFFDNLSAVKVYGGGPNMPNIGAFELRDRGLLEQQARDVLERYPWQVDVSEDFLAVLDVSSRATASNNARRDSPSSRERL